MRTAAFTTQAAVLGVGAVILLTGQLSSWTWPLVGLDLAAGVLAASGCPLAHLAVTSPSTGHDSSA